MIIDAAEVIGCPYSEILKQPTGDVYGGYLAWYLNQNKIDIKDLKINTSGLHLDVITADFIEGFMFAIHDRKSVKNIIWETQFISQKENILKWIKDWKSPEEVEIQRIKDLHPTLRMAGYLKKLAELSEVGAEMYIPKSDLTEDDILNLTLYRDELEPWKNALNNQEKQFLISIEKLFEDICKGKDLNLTK